MESDMNTKLLTSDETWEIIFGKLDRRKFKEQNWPCSVTDKIIELTKNTAQDVEKRCNCIVPFFYSKDEKTCLEYKNCAEEMIKSESRFWGVAFGKFDYVGIQMFPHAYWTSYFRMQSFGIFHELMNIPSSKVIFDSNRSTDGQQSKKFFLLTLARTVRPTDRQNPAGILKSLLTSLKKNSHELKSYNTEVYLTYSTYYPIVFKSEFDDFGQFSNYLALLNNCSSVSETSSFILTSQYLNNITTLKNVSIALLVKVRGNSEDYVIKRIKKLLKDHNIVSKSSKIEAFHRAFYWDIDFHFKTKHVGKLIQLVTTELTTIDHIKNVVTLPFWTPEKGGLPTDKLVKNVDDPPSYSVAQLTKKMKQLHSLFPALSYENSLVPSKDRLSRKVYEAKFDSEWLITQMEHLTIAWSRVGRLYFPRTFNVLQDSMKRMLDDIKALILHVNTYKLHKETEMLMQNTETGCFTSGVFARNYKTKLQDAWQYLAKIELKQHQLSKLFQSLIMRFNEECESRHVVSEVNPHIRFCERAGLLDMYLIAANRLLKAYCGRPKPEILHAPWNGLVVSSASRDYRIDVNKQILYLPVDFRMNVHHKLHILAHESAHFILGNISKDKKQTSIGTFWNDLHSNAAELAKQMKEDLSQLGFSRNAGIEDQIHDKFEKIERFLTANVISASNETKINFADSEVLCDAIACLSAGPEYFRSLANISFNPVFQHPIGDEHPSAWLRVQIGCFISQYQKWHKTSWGKLWESFIKTIDIYSGVAKASTAYLWNEKDFRKEQLAEQTILDPPVDPSVLDQNLYIIKALFDNDGALFAQLVDWIKDNFDDYFFFEYPFTNSSIEESYRTCQNLANRINEGEVILEGSRLRDIAAASLLEPLRRPRYPSGRIIHSLYYCNP
jgi:hypothetical protein